MSIFILGTKPVFGQIVEDGLISYWTFDEADIDGDTVKDIVGGQHGTMQGAPKIVGGRIGNALEFNGVSDWVLVSDDINTMKIPTKEISAEVWVYPEIFIEWGGYLSCFQDNGSFEKGWTLGTNHQMSFAVSTENPDDGDGTLNYLTAGIFDVENWYHVVGTYDGSSLKIYVNGEEKRAFLDIHSGEIQYPPNAFLTIGIYKDDNEHFPHKGMIDEVRLYEKALSQDEVVQNYGAEGMSVEPMEKLTTRWGNIKSLR
jgi:hypothetical protein